MILVARSLCLKTDRPKSSSSLEEFERLVNKVERKILEVKEPKKTTTLKSSKAGQKRHRASESKQPCDSSADVDECAICGSLLKTALDATARGEFRYTRCVNEECGALYQRCCVTLRMVGLAEIASGHVRRCKTCDSIAFVDYTSPVTDSHVNVNGGPGGGMQTEDYLFPFSWAWWSGDSPLCPYCGIVMSLR